MNEQALEKPSSLKSVLARDEVKKRMREILGKRSEQFGAALVQIVNQNYSLQKCDPNSILGVAMTAAALDLSVDPNLGEAHIVPYGDKATFQIGYIGFNQLAMRSGQYKNLGWKVVHEGELKRWEELSGELEVDSSNPNGAVVGYAAKFKLINGFERGLYWTTEQCKKHAEKYSKAYKAGINNANKRDSVWWTDFDRGALKTVLKMLLKLWGPKSIQMQKAMKMDEAQIIDADSEIVEYPDTTQPPKTATPLFSTPAKELQEATEVENKTIDPILELREKCAAEKITETQLIAYMKEMGSIEGDAKTFEEVFVENDRVIGMALSQFNTVASNLKSKKV
jgi:recombination protein RecT